MPFPYCRIGFIGVGAMGKYMVQNLAKKTTPETEIFLHDINQKAVDSLCDEFPGKLTGCSSASEVANKADITFTMLPESQHVRSVYLDSKESISTADLSGKILLECSTIDTATNLSIRSSLQTPHPTAHFYDAPVSGGVLGAERGTLGIFLGCADTDTNFPPLQSLLSLLGKSVIPCGGPSLGLVAKLANNYLSGTIAIATSEAMNMGMRAGMDARVLAQVIAAGSGQNHIADKFNPVPGISPEAPSSKGYEGGFRVELMRKDISLATRMAAEVGAHMVLGEATLGAYVRATEDERCKGLDSRVVYRLIGGDEDWATSSSEQ